MTLQYVVNYLYMNDTNMTYLENNNETGVWYGTMSVRLVYPGRAWLGFAVSPNGLMVGSSAVIGLPPEYNETLLMDGYVSMGNVSQYSLTFDDEAPGYLLDDNQALMDATVTQDENYTILEFTRYLEQDGVVPINGTGFNYFLVAHGTDRGNMLGYHGPSGRSSFNLTLSPCVVAIPELFDEVVPFFDEEGVGSETPALGEPSDLPPDEESEVPPEPQATGEETEPPSTSEGTGGPSTLASTSGTSSFMEKQSMSMALLSIMITGCMMNWT